MKTIKRVAWTLFGLVVVMHNPTTFGTMPDSTARLAMAGHMHGGQVRLPFTPSWSWLTFVKEDAMHADGGSTRATAGSAIGST